jgi:hypothetical protein
VVVQEEEDQDEAVEEEEAAVREAWMRACMPTYRWRSWQRT